MVLKDGEKKDAVDNKDDSFEDGYKFGGKIQQRYSFHEKMEEFDTIVKQQIMSNSKK
jgi:hypothetical protein